MSSKKFVLYKFFKILFSSFSLKSSLISISPNITIVSADILSFPKILILVIFSAFTVLIIDVTKNSA